MFYIRIIFKVIAAVLITVAYFIDWTSCLLTVAACLISFVADTFKEIEKDNDPYGDDMRNRL